MPVFSIAAADDPRLADYTAVADPDLAQRRGLFVVEGRLTVRRLVTGGRFRVVSLLLSEAARRELEPIVSAADPSVPVYVCPLHAFRAITGFNLHRGCLALARRPAAIDPRDVAAGRRVVVLESITNADNVGGIFRNAAAFGVDGVLMNAATCDPLYRKAIRTSMAASLVVPFARIPWPEALADLRAAGLTIVALTPHASAQPLDRFVATRPPGDRLALLFGSEGAGLSEAASAAADIRVRIPMSSAVDSLNVAVAAGIVLSRLTPFADV